MAARFIRKAGAAGAAVAAVAGISFAASAFAAGPGHETHGTTAATHGTAAHRTAPDQGVAPAAAPVKHEAPEVVRQVIGHGSVDGTSWSVTLEYYPTLPKGYRLPSPMVPGPASSPAKAPATSLLCQRMVIGGVRIDHQGGPWSDCQPVNGAHDPGASGEEGLWGLHDKGTTGTRLIVANSYADIAYGVVTLTDGRHLQARTVFVPHTSYSAWAVAIPTGKTIATIDQFDIHGKRVGHETYWR